MQKVQIHSPTFCAVQRGWQVQDGQVLFQSNEEEGVEDVPAVDLIKHALTYARELERIV